MAYGRTRAAGVPRHDSAPSHAYTHRDAHSHANGDVHTGPEAYAHAYAGPEALAHANVYGKPDIYANTNTGSAYRRSRRKYNFGRSLLD